MNKLVLFGTVVSALVLIGCGPAVDIETEKAALREADVQSLKAFEAKDVEGMTAFYAENASVYPPNHPIVTGREAIQELWVGLVANPGFALSWEPVNVEMAKSGDLAWVQETYRFSMENAEGELQEDRGKAVLVWKKQADGSWKIVADIFNSDLPLAEPSDNPN